jgi:4-diphosphocytidyl-2-C-methyl-D-erythritol kinase
MNTVKIKSYAKINLTLEVKGLEGNYHLLDSLVASVDLFDYIVIKKRKGGLSFVTMKGMGSESIPPEKNNALKAAEAFSKRFETGGVDITIYKNIPIGAGLGGSSADVCGVLNGMAKLYNVRDRVALKELADGLGSDTGYMLDGGFARMQGRGEKVTKLPIHEKLYFLLLCPDSMVSAGACYKRYDELPKTLEERGSYTQNCIDALLKKDVNAAGRYAMNDLFRAALQLNGDVGKAYADAESFSPICTVMTGSGSGVLAMFETKELCEWAKSRYKGKFAAYVTQTLVPDYAGKKKGWKNPFALSEEEKENLGDE